MSVERPLGTHASVLYTVNAAATEATGVCQLRRVMNWRSIPIRQSFRRLYANLPSTSVTRNNRRRPPASVQTH